MVGLDRVYMCIPDTTFHDVTRGDRYIPETTFHMHDVTYGSSEKDVLDSWNHFLWRDVWQLWEGRVRFLKPLSVTWR